MPVYQAKDRVRSGVPLGGIGTGKLEILPNGAFSNFTFQNNWSKPLLGSEEYPAVLGYHFGFFAEPLDDPKRKKAFLLQTVPVLDIPTVRDIRYEAHFPAARLFYAQPELGLEVSLEAFSPWIPADIKNSSLPASFFTFRVANKSRRPVKAAFLFIGRNVCGKWCVGRENRVYDERRTLHLEFRNTDPSGRDVRQGAIRFSFLKHGWETSFLESWNAVTRNFAFDSKNISLLAWDFFSRSGSLPNTRSIGIVRGENQEFCGAVAARRGLAAGSEARLTFTGSWYFPRHPLGHRYERWFKDIAQVSRYAVTKKNFLERQVDRVQRAVFSLPFPRWFNDALLTSLAPFFSSSWFVKDGRFVFYEAPSACPLMGTLDVGYYGSIPLSYFFPQLEISQISQFAKAQRKDGYIPHDLGKNRIDLPSDGTTFFRWKDLNPKFILMVYRDFLWSGDRRFLRAMVPHVKRAMDWTLLGDRDGNGLPENEGQDQTFDLWAFYGTHAYTSGIFLAALLACRKMALFTGDKRLAGYYEGCFRKASRSFERELWNGKFFGQDCTLFQLNGQWYADLLGLGSIADDVKIKKALGLILRTNARHSRFGMVNSVRADGRLDLSNEHSRNIWAGMNYAFISLCLLRGFSLRNLLKEALKLWGNVALIQKSPWNQPDTVDSKTGRFVFGDSYYRNMAIWAIPIALAMKDAKTARVLRSLRRAGLPRDS